MIVKYGEPVIFSSTIKSCGNRFFSLHQTDICVHIQNGVRPTDWKISMKVLYFDLCCGFV